MRAIARRWQQLNGGITDHEKILTKLTRQLVPDLVAAHGIGPDTAAEMLIVAGDNANRVRSEPVWARLLGPLRFRPPLDDNAPPLQPRRVPVSQRGALPGGHRADAIHAPTKAYVARRAAEGKTK